MKRVLSLVLAVAMLTIVFMVAGCGGTTPEVTTGSDKPAETTGGSAETTGAQPAETTGTQPAETTAPAGETTGSTPVETTAPPVVTDPFEGYDGTEKLPGFEDVDFRGREFVIAGDSDESYAFSKTASKEIYSEGQDTISVAVRKRNEIIGKLYNCKIKLVENVNPRGLAGADVTGNKHTIDFAMLRADALMNVAKKGSAFYNMYNFDINFEDPWWDQNYIMNSTIRNSSGEKTLVGVVGDFSLFTMSCTYTLMFNKRVYESAGIESKVGDIYDFAKKGTWTFDVFAQMVKEAAVETSGNSKLDVTEGDVMGWIRTDQASNALMMASNMTFMENKDGVLKFTAGENTAAWDTVINKAIELFALEQSQEVSYASIPDYVSADKSLFVSEVLDVLARWKNSDISMGLVPYPKVTETQDNYAHFVEGHYQALGVPVSVPEIAELASFLEIFAGHSRFITRPAWIDSYSYEFCNDVESADMLNIILDTRVYDPCYGLNDFRKYFNEIGSMARTQKNNFTKWIARNADKANSEIASYITARF